MGVLVMAHGGTDAWNASVRKAVEPLEELLPTEVAFGMADPLTLGAGIASLEQAGVRRIAVVRMFLSGESFAQQTRYLLGLSASRPGHFMLMGDARQLGPTPAPLAHRSEIATHEEGIMGSPEAAQIISARVLNLDAVPEKASVLLVAHGMGEEAANDRVLHAMKLAAREIEAHGFAAVAVETLREDWPEERSAAEARIRTFVTVQASMEREVIVAPYRLSGFGPYAEVLSGLPYTPTEGLLPHPKLSDWIRRTTLEVICAREWTTSLGSCNN